MIYPSPEANKASIGTHYKPARFEVRTPTEYRCLTFRPEADIGVHAERVQRSLLRRAADYATPEVGDELIAVFSCLGIVAILGLLIWRAAA